MDIKYIEIGETYLLPVTATAIKNFGWIEVATTKDYRYLLASSEVSTLLPNSIKNTEPAPKYDPCRPFRQGDKVRPVERYGRNPDDGAPVNVICEVVEDELKNGTVAIRARENCGSVRFRVTALYLELVTPVEEVERYYIEHDTTGFAIVDRLNVGYVAHFKAVQHPHAKEAAEAECARLNAEYRREKSNESE